MEKISFIIKMICSFFVETRNKTNFLDYMHALTNTEQEDTTQDLELIRMQVQAMAELAQKQIQDSYRGIGQ